MTIGVEGASERLAKLAAAIGTVIRGKDDVVRRLIQAILCRGHVLVEDVPGVGKTTLARALARSLDVHFQRIQFTSDTLPSDILGVSIFREGPDQFEFRPGPIFSNVVLADEINRATPKTQSALLEAMSEGAVTVEGRRRELPTPFFVVATQNPTESVGTYPLPESQLDRFLFRLSVGYPDAASEKEILRGAAGEELLGAVRPVVDAAGVIELQNALDRVRVDEKILEYVLAIVSRTRSGGGFRVGASPRAARGLVQASRAEALLSARTFVSPADVKAVAIEVLCHRVSTTGRGDLAAAAAAIRGVLDETEVPR